MTMVPSTSSESTNPSLKKYFQYMVKSRKLTIQFSQNKITEIIKNDLEIAFDAYSPLLQSVSIEAFAFYIQGWPGWQPEFFQLCIDDTEKSYVEFKKFLKDKISNLAEKEKIYCADSYKETLSKLVESKIGIDPTKKKVSCILTPPMETFRTLPSNKSGFKIKLPYYLEITANPSTLNGLVFERSDNNTILTVNDNISVRNMNVLEVLNHSYVSMQFKMPSLIKFRRKNMHRIEMFLCKPTDTWTFPKHDQIVDIRKFPSRNNIYSWKFFQEFFQKLNSIINSYSNWVSIFRVCNVS